MMPLHFKWEWDLSSPPQALWPLVSDTNRFNRDAGLPAVEDAGYKKNPSAPSPARRVIKARAAGMTLEWEEKPFEWIAPFEFGVERFFKNGPLEKVKVKVRLQPKSGGTRILYESWVTPKNLLGQWAVQTQMRLSVQPKLKRLLERYDRGISSSSTVQPKVSVKPWLHPELTAFSNISPLAEKLADLIASAEDLDLIRMRPFALAEKWHESPRAVLEIFLKAAHQKLLEFQWEIICPHCRGAEKRGPSLGIISQEGYCQGCDLHYTVNFHQLVELTFRPNPRIRKISAVFFCTGGPRVTPHIIMRQTLEPGEKRRLLTSLRPGLYRIRTLHSKTEKITDVTDSPSLSTAFTLTSTLIEGPNTAGTLDFSFENKTPNPECVTFERMEWDQTRVTGRDVMHMPLFRELFETQCLRPNQPIASGELTFVFTDLKGSTKLYQEIGDATAFCRVLTHFDILEQAVSAHGGTVIKTIGDSVMAVFDHPAEALIAMASAQKALAYPPEGQAPLELKVGIHKGGNLVANLNNRLDYFGSTVNIAARLVGFSSGKDIILSSEIAQDRDVSVFLNQGTSGFLSEKIQTLIRGFGRENFTLFKLTAK